VIEGEVLQQLEPVLNSTNLTRVQRSQLLDKVVSIVRTEAFTGPLPHPSHLEHYGQVIPNGADRIMKMAELSLSSNVEVRQKGQWYDQVYRVLGMVLGFVALMVMIGAAVVAGIYGYNVLAGLLLGTTVIGSAGMFITAHHKK
jgi:uncharacterized membrane protein